MEFNGDQVEQELWENAQFERASKYEQQMINTLGTGDEDGVTGALTRYLPEEIVEEMVENSSGLGIFVLDEDELKNRGGDSFYNDQNVVITRHRYMPKIDPLDKVINKYIKDLNFDDTPELQSSVPDGGIEIVAKNTDENEEDGEPPKYVYTAWIKVEKMGV